MSLDWPRVKELHWKQRKAAIVAALREYLTARGANELPLSTMALAGELCPEDKCAGWYAITYQTGIAALAKELSKLAPYQEPFARHDGEKIIRWGRQWQRWNWYGQGEGK